MMMMMTTRVHDHEIRVVSWFISKWTRRILREFRTCGRLFGARRLLYQISFRMSGHQNDGGIMLNSLTNQRLQTRGLRQHAVDCTVCCMGEVMVFLVLERQLAEVISVALRCRLR
jgi:hypothetical protein